MPKVVDHAERRREIIAAVWKIIASEGLEAVTTRRIADATGYANGTLGYYFSGKDEVISAAFEHVYNATNVRVDSAAPDRRGLRGLRVLCLEIMPLDDDRLDEARVVLTFWQQALHSAENSRLHAELINRWREEMEQRIEEAREDGDIDEVDVSAVVDELLSMLMGLQVLALLSPNETAAERQLAQFEGFLSRLRTRAGAERV